MTKVLFLCPAKRDRRELARFAGGIEFLFHDYGTTALEDMLIEHRRPAPLQDPVAECDALAARFAGDGLDAVISADDYPGSTLACILAQRLGLPAPDPAVNLLCQHKYACRRAQLRLVPEATPDFALVNTHGAFTPPAHLALPAFIKPIKSFFSIGAQKLSAWSEIEAIRSWWAARDDFFAPFERLLERYAGLAVGCGRLLLESLLHGQQVTVEGFAYRGAVEVFGIVDSVMFPGTIVFQRFVYPSQLPTGVQQRMADIARRLMQGIGFDNGMFNIEMMYDGERDLVSIIEINPRMASQFGDLYEKVDGSSSYAALLDIALGRKPQMLRRKGPYAMAASCVLRVFSDRRIVAQPSAAEIDRLAERFLGLRVEAVGSVGERLSDSMQDGHSFRYGLIHLGGRDQQDIDEALRECERGLTFGLRPTQALEPAHPFARAST